MWQAPNRNRGYTAKRKTTPKRRANFHLKRVEAELKIMPHKSSALSSPDSNPVLQGRVILNDIGEKGMGLFVSDPVLVGQDVAITMENPTRIYLKARVVACQEVGTPNGILQENPFSYRITLQFEFSSEDEKEQIRAFCKEMITDHLNIPKAA